MCHPGWEGSGGFSPEHAANSMAESSVKAVVEGMLACRILVLFWYCTVYNVIYS